MAGENIQILKDGNFKEALKTSKIPVLVDFWAEWCAPCRMITPLVEEVAAEYKDRIMVAKLNIDENQATPSELKILSIPTLVIFKEGQEAERIVGFQTKKELFAMVEKHL
ncbi:thioredoxin [Peptococcaceae bacterium SCADC1_2_3]|nr:thioredoxin [Peptococcaceae bacterium SCADC1_2_3]KFI35083.1 thioredoxin [Peptococcaceae bacterium SCADC1_2_3]KFI36796.1 thioredoxin [Peptococcaceae bacterium SCADC1_2_3]KFI38022.1 thioredoxin [Peptococcaceae bacterium SCADC1_2_3]HBQ28330.1 thioredoxin [Desulfotomaculum sp.]